MSQDIEAARSEALLGGLITQFTVWGSDNTPYLVRWSLYFFKRQSLKLHHILRPDSDKCLHDHPWWFWRVVLWGGYWEEREDGKTYRIWPLIPYYCPPHFKHRITKLRRKSSWTLCLCGTRKYSWAFYNGDTRIPWKDFVDLPQNQKIGWCSEEPEKT